MPEHRDLHLVGVGSRAKTNQLQHPPDDRKRHRPDHHDNQLASGAYQLVRAVTLPWHPSHPCTPSWRTPAGLLICDQRTRPARPDTSHADIELGRDGHCGPQGSWMRTALPWLPFPAYGAGVHTPRLAGATNIAAATRHHTRNANRPLALLGIT
jgi:hypothetical protein